MGEVGKIPTSGTNRNYIIRYRSFRQILGSTSYPLAFSSLASVSDMNSFAPPHTPTMTFDPTTEAMGQAALGRKFCSHELEEAFPPFNMSPVLREGYRKLHEGGAVLAAFSLIE